MSVHLSVTLHMNCDQTVLQKLKISTLQDRSVSRLPACLADQIVVSSDAESYWGRPVAHGKMWGLALRLHSTACMSRNFGICWAFFSLDRLCAVCLVSEARKSFNVLRDWRTRRLCSGGRTRTSAIALSVFAGHTAPISLTSLHLTSPDLISADLDSSEPRVRGDWSQPRRTGSLRSATQFAAAAMNDGGALC